VYALDPKGNRLRLHDIRLRRLADMLTDGGQFVYTPEQLLYACERKRLRSSAETIGPGCAIGAAVVGIPLLLVGAFAGIPALLGLGGFAALLFAVTGALALWGAIGRVKPAVSQRAFERTVINRWWRVYGEPPPGLAVPAGPYGSAPVPPVGPAPRLAVVCPDGAVGRCLRANAVQQRLGVFVVNAPAEAPPGVPLAVLHDASPQGILFAARLRAALPGRSVTDLGLPPAAVAPGSKAAKLRSRRPPKAVVEELRAHARLTDGELNLLARGWWSPVAALPPGVLISMLEQAAERVEVGTDMDRRHAYGVGFMTWPTPA
jgi:hypothetical protein